MFKIDKSPRTEKTSFSQTCIQSQNFSYVNESKVHFHTEVENMARFRRREESLKFSRVNSPDSYKYMKEYNSTKKRTYMSSLIDAWRRVMILLAGFPKQCRLRI